MQKPYRVEGNRIILLYSKLTDEQLRHNIIKFALNFLQSNIDEDDEFRMILHILELWHEDTVCEKEMNRVLTMLEQMTQEY